MIGWDCSSVEVAGVKCRGKYINSASILYIIIIIIIWLRTSIYILYKRKELYKIISPTMWSFWEFCTLDESSEHCTGVSNVDFVLFQIDNKLINLQYETDNFLWICEPTSWNPKFENIINYLWMYLQLEPGKSFIFVVSVDAEIIRT